MTTAPLDGMKPIRLFRRMMRPRYTLPLSILILLVAIWAGCPASHLPGLPPGSPFASAPGSAHAALSDGIAVGDPTDHSAVVWVRTNGPAAVRLEYGPTVGGAGTGAVSFQAIPHQPMIFNTDAARDYTLSVPLEGLRSATSYGVRVTTDRHGEAPKGRSAPPTETETLTARFTTLPDPTASTTVQFAWSADLGGQEHCRDAAAGYPIFDVLRSFPLNFFVFLGDTVYADETCSVPPNAPGSEFPATTLEAFRAKHRYQRASLSLQRFLAEIPVFVVWDDHEVRNNFSGPYEERMPAGRQALFEYWPIRRDRDDPHRLYRLIRAGSSVEIFLLDTRQYRSRNSEPDGPSKTMLGEKQLAWLLEGLAHSTAKWKVIASSVPLSTPKGGSLKTPGNDGWANGTDGTGFETELQRIAQWIVSRKVRNVVWLAADVHFVQANVYDVDHDGRPDFHEFVAGPLSAAGGRMIPPRSPFGIQTLVHEGGYKNFGIVRADDASFDVTIIDESGRRRFTHRIAAQ